MLFLVVFMAAMALEKCQDYGYQHVHGSDLWTSSVFTSINPLICEYNRRSTKLKNNTMLLRNRTAIKCQTEHGIISPTYT